MKKLWMFLFSFLSFGVVGDDGGGEGDPSAGGAEGSGSDGGTGEGGAPDGGEGGAPGDSGGEGEAGAATGKEEGKEEGPTTMLEAIEQGLKKTAEGEKKTEEVKAGEKPKPGEKPKQGELDDDPLAMPEGLSPKGQQRFQRLVGMVKEHEKEKQQLTSEINNREEVLNGFRDYMQQAGMRPEQFTLSTQYVKAVNTGDLATAKNILLGELKALSLQLGEDISGGAADPLSAFPDLAEDVRAYKITPERAMEIARARQAETANRATREANDRQSRDIANFQHVAREAMVDIDKMTREWRKTDFDYPQIEKLVIGTPDGRGGFTGGRLHEIVQNFHPSVWPLQIKMVYDSIKAGRAVAAPAATGSGQRPLPTGKAPSGAAPAPKTMHDAMWGSKQA